MRSGVLRLRIPSELDHVFLVGLAINGICARVLGAEEGVYEAELSVVEAVNNAIEHAYRGAPGHSVEVVVRVDEQQLTFEVGDMGEPMNWQNVLTTSESEPDLRRESGRGLSIILSCMDSVSYRSEAGKNVLTLVKRRRESTREPVDRLS
jgi:serine/threonine-protein kinase RsbW